MLVIATGFIPLSPLSLSIVPTMVMSKGSQSLGKHIVWRVGQKNSRKAWIAETLLKTELITIQLIQSIIHDTGSTNPSES